MLSILNQRYGHWLSVKTGESVNSHGQPVPWYSYPAVEYLSQLDFSDKLVFEWGAGNSSKFWARLGKAVTSVEDDLTWYNEVAALRSENQSIMFITDQEAYIKAIARSGQRYDVISIDGSYRYECARIASDFLADGGLIILDNADWLPKTARLLREAGLLQVDMHGYAPIAKYTLTTSLFFHRQFKFASREGRQPHASAAAIPVPVDFLSQEPH
jgi:hypothetical protein